MPFNSPSPCGRGQGEGWTPHVSGTVSQTTKLCLVGGQREQEGGHPGQGVGAGLGVAAGMHLAGGVAGNAVTDAHRHRRVEIVIGPGIGHQRQQRRAEPAREHMAWGGRRPVVEIADQDEQRRGRPPVIQPMVRQARPESNAAMSSKK